MTTYTPEQRAAMIAALREECTQGHHHETVSLPDRAASMREAAPSTSHDALKADNERLREALLSIARKAEMLKQECGDNPESPQAIRNGRYMHISYVARAAIKGGE